MAALVISTVTEDETEISDHVIVAYLIDCCLYKGLIIMCCILKWWFYQ